MKENAIQSSMSNFMIMLYHWMLQGGYRYSEPEGCQLLAFITVNIPCLFTQICQRP